MTQPIQPYDPDPALTMRALGDAISPTYLRGPVMSSYRYSMSVLYDDLIDLATLAVFAGLASYAPPDALPWIALDRQVFQGPNEPVTVYIPRLAQWLDAAKFAGSTTAVMVALLAWFYPLAPKMLMVQSSGPTAFSTLMSSTWYTYQAGSAPFPPPSTVPTPPARYLTIPVNWEWDNLGPPFYSPWMYWRSWIVIFSPSGSPWAAPSATWSPATGTATTSVVSDPVFGTAYQGSGGSGSNASEFNWDSSVCWDWTGTADQAQQMAQIAKDKKSAGCWIPWIIVAYDATMFDETQASGSSKLPNGNWGYWGIVATDATFGTAYVAARPASATCSFIAGTNDGGGVLGIG